MSSVHRRGALLSGLLLSLAMTLVAAPAVSKDAPKDAKPADKATILPRESVDASIFRGGLVYANYCVTCHGFNADGNGRAARLYNPKPANLRMSDKNDAYLGLIIRKGGEALGRSQFMPIWEAELTEEQINDVVTYVRSINMRPKD
jgi:mono/diheme cytochrome c family protein